MQCTVCTSSSDCQNIAIHIIESHENFAGETLIELHHLAQYSPTTICVGHLDELHMYQQQQ